MKTVKLKHGTGTRMDIHGWCCIRIEGRPYERGVAHGRLVADDLRNIRKTLEYIVLHDFGVPWDFFVRGGKKYLRPVIEHTYPEFFEEMRGIADGAKLPLDFIVAWNNYFTLTESWWAHLPEEEAEEVYGSGYGGEMGQRKRSPGGEGGGTYGRIGRQGAGGQQERCSAFIANGAWTTDGSIVMAHNNFSNFVDGQFAKYVVDIRPAKGHRINMVSFAGWIWSGTDFFVTSRGIMGCETTIGGFLAYEPRLPISCRIRDSMQYGNSLDDYVTKLLNGNSGDYANSWLFGDTRSNEIMRFELGLRFHQVERTKNGFFVGFNAPTSPQIRNLECADTGYEDVRRHQGARRVRLSDLMDEHKGRIDLEVAKAVLADHYDVYLGRVNPCSRTCCAHYELDAREYMSDPSRPKPFQPRGALDGNVCDSAMAKRMGLMLRWGNSCGTPFDKDAFCDQHHEWAHLRPFLEDRPQQPWVEISASSSTSSTSSTSSSSLSRSSRRKRTPKKSGKKHTRRYNYNNHNKQRRNRRTRTTSKH
jgi:hypothetical protein